MKKLPFKPPRTSKVTVEVCESPGCYGWERGSHVPRGAGPEYPGALKNLHKTVATGSAQRTVDAAFRLARIQAKKTRSWRYVSVGWGRGPTGAHHACVLTSSTSPHGQVGSWKLDEHKFGCKPPGVTGREFAGARRRRR